MKNYLLLIFVSYFSVSLFSQETGNILLIPASDCTITINGEEEINCLEGEPYKVQLPFGEHFIQATDGENKTSKIVEVSDAKQKIVKLDFASKSTTAKTAIVKNKAKPTESILISNQQIKLLGGINEIDPEAEILTEDNHQFYYLAKGDKIKLSTSIQNKKGKFSVKLYSYPDLNVVFSKTKLREQKGQLIHIRKDGIFILEITTSALLDKTLNLKVERIPASEEFADLNTNVEKRYRFETVKVGKTSQFVNSTSNETFRGGKSRLVIPVNIPSDAIEWYYSFAASRNKADIEQGMNNVSLLSQVTKAVGGLSPTTAAINFGINIFSAPPGADYCDVYLLDHANSTNFKNGGAFIHYPHGTRENLKSSTIKLNCCTDQPYYLGIQNKDLTAGIQVGVEIVAIRRIEYLAAETELNQMPSK